MMALDTERKLAILGEQAQFDVSAPNESLLRREAPAAVEERTLAALTHCIYPAAVSGGRCMPVLKVLMTNACRNDCHYCATRCSANIRRTAFRPEELARAFLEMERRRLVQGLFLSSGIAGEPDRVQQLIVDTAAILRKKHGYRGYLHLKVLPGASDAAIEETVRLASRASVNLEAPNAQRLATLAADKRFADELGRALQRTAEYARAMRLRSGVTTQYVVGAAGESDAELIRTTDLLYRKLGLRRAYYSGFRPIEGTPLEDVPAAPTERIHRLYQADWLMRQYGFEAGELVFGEEGNLARGVDPKQAWAAAHPEFFPVELTTADREALLRVPGIGPVAAGRMVLARRTGLGREEKDLAAMGVWASRAARYVTVGGKPPGRRVGGQLELPFGDMA
jgi:predicted DNA-binding helix-hairpin-helix protein